MNRRGLMGAIAALAAGATRPATATAPPTDAPNVRFESRSSAWLDRQLEAHFDDPVDSHPDAGYYRQARDTSVNCFADREAAAWTFAVLDLVAGMRYTEGRYDCEDLSRAVAHYAAEAAPMAAIGRVIDREVGHAWNLTVLADGTVLEYDPMRQAFVPDARRIGDQDYGPGAGVILL